MELSMAMFCENKIDNNDPTKRIVYQTFQHALLFTQIFISNRSKIKFPDKKHQSTFLQYTAATTCVFAVDVVEVREFNKIVHTSYFF